MEHKTECTCCCNANADDKKETAFGMDEEMNSLLNDIERKDNNSFWFWAIAIIIMAFYGKSANGSTQNPYDISIVDKILFHMSEVNIRFK